MRQNPTISMKEHFKHLGRHGRIYFSQRETWKNFALLMILAMFIIMVDVMWEKDMDNTRQAQKIYNQYKKMMKIVPASQKNALEKYCDKYDVPIFLMLRLVQAESEWNPACVGARNENGTVDYGLTQINSANLESFKRQYYSGKEPFDVFNPIHALEVSVRFLRDLYNIHKSWADAVAAYNSGSYSVFNNRIPRSTQAYVKKILGSREFML
jgi:soluble lytic murein transglycosylase-like protein